MDQFRINQVIEILSKSRVDITNEKSAQEELHAILINRGFNFIRHPEFDKKNIPDFFLDGLVIEVKLKGTPRDIYRQCERYCGFSQVQQLILYTNKSMGFPEEINQQPCYFVNLGNAYL